MKQTMIILSMFIMMLSCGRGNNSKEAVQIPADVQAIIDDYNLEELSDDDKKYKINLGYYNCDHMTAACVGEDTGIFKALGLNVTVTGNGNVPEAMSAGQMDMAYAGFTTTLNAVKNKVPLFIAAENHTGGAEYFVVSKDINKPEDLLNKRISMGANAETVNLNWAEWTEQLNIPRDTTYYENFSMSDSDAYFAFKLGQLDGYGACDPWGSMAEYENTGKILKRQNTDREIDGHGTCCKVCMNYNFAKAHPKLAERILLAHAMSIEYMYLHPYKAAQIFAENYNVPLEVGLMTLWKKLNEEGRTITWKLNRDYVHNQMKTMKRLGVRDDINSLDIDDYIDLSYFDNCGAKDFDVFLKEEVDPIFPLGMSYEEWRAKAVEVDNIKEEPEV
ncbi:ABC transporter substrate-binding subunit SaoX [Brachyspira murdochii]|uniref:ABC-type nitrate/sulfonate/bicarbonate transport system, periplasmic components n=1 Tax=Brachyspira murdochii (strain ATCC 51284 / DSM 12563 / 56-150) TaxID=526224 RepID=D5U6C1_BRAM5|nr:ABC transporter substrate-binding subunit SaoX [Brachyspira murdochii]ADG72620.1 ABC-type nitrate/sulfonate/bicarbonate transport system, periplasmic components [Brachyspira murdochii DSM 12563]